MTASKTKTEIKTKTVLIVAGWPKRPTGSYATVPAKLANKWIAQGVAIAGKPPKAK